MIAREAGTYAGISSNYSGGGFSGMRFKAIATSQQDFEDWVRRAKASDQPLTPAVYAELSKASTNVPVAHYSAVPTGMFDFLMHNQMSQMAGVDAGLCAPSSTALIAVAE